MKYGHKDNGFIGRLAPLNAQPFDIIYLTTFISNSTSQQRDCEAHKVYEDSSFK